MNKSLKKGIKDVKEGKVTKINSIEELFKEERKWKKRHPILAKLKYFYYRILALNGLPINIYLGIKTFIQRGKRGWGDTDVWGFDYYLAKVISEGTEYLKINHCGHPVDLTDREWKSYLKKIANTFKLAQQMIDHSLWFRPEDEKRIREVKKVIRKLNKNHETNVRMITKKELKAYEEGWDIFQYYFNNLWD